MIYQVSINVAVNTSLSKQSVSGSPKCFIKSLIAFRQIFGNIYANLSNAENTPNYIDSLSNGFKIRNTGQNTSGQTYVYACFAEAPFKYANAR